MISGQAFSGQMFAYTPREMWLEYRGYITLLWQAFFAVGIGPGVLGLAALHRRSLRLAVMLDLMWLFSTVFYVNYRVIDKNTMFLPSFLIFALWVGIGYRVILDWFQVLNEPTTPKWILAVPRMLMVGAVLLAIGWNWRLVDLSQDWSTRAARRGDPEPRGKRSHNLRLVGYRPCNPVPAVCGREAPGCHSHQPVPHRTTRYGPGD